MAGASTPTKARSIRPRPWWRSGRGRPTCWSRSASTCRCGIKRGYHRHYNDRRQRAARRGRWSTPPTAISITPMEQGIRLTTGAEFAARDAAPTPVQFDRLMPRARECCFRLGAPTTRLWLGARPCFPDSAPGDRPRARPEGHVAGDRACALGADARSGDGTADRRNDGGETPFSDPKPYAAERFQIAGVTSRQHICRGCAC